MDVLWTDAVQPDNTEHLASRANIEHELIIAVLTSGPVGFGDSLPHPGFAAGAPRAVWDWRLAAS